MAIISPNFYYFVFVFVAITLLIILFKKEKTVPKFLRACSLFLLLSCLFEPIFRITFASQPWVLVLIDTSQSMEVGGKLDKVKQILSEIKFKREICGFDVHPYLISSRSFHTITAKGTLTSIGNALLETPSPSAYLLLSDGINNFGPDPISIAHQKDIPIYTVKIGDSITGDIRISGLIYDKVIYSKDEVPIKVRFENTGYSGQEVQILLKEDNHILQKKNMLLSQNNSQNEFEFSVAPGEVGMHLYEVDISEFPGEINKENNRRKFGTMVLKSKIKVGWFSAAPSWNFKFAKLELAHNPDIEFDWWIKVKEGRWLSKNGIIPTADFDASYDAVVLENFDYPEVEKLIDKGTGVIIIGEACKGISPFSLGSSIMECNDSIVANVEDFPLFGSKELPPLREIYSVKGFKGGAKVLCKTQEGTPLIARSGLIIGIAANDVWRWNFSSGLNFWAKLIKLIALKGPTLFVEAEPVIEVGERVIFKAEAYTQTYEPDANRDIVVKVVPLEGMLDSVDLIEVSLYSLGDGKYEGAVEFLPPGKYKYEVTIVGLKPAPTNTKGEFIVTSHLEFRELSSDFNFLHTLSSVSGGKYIEDIKDLSDNISAELVLPKKSELPFNLSYSYFSLFLIILLLTVEWIWLHK